MLVEWGDVAASALGDHLEVRLIHVETPTATDDDAGDAADALRRRVRRSGYPRDRDARGRARRGPGAGTGSPAPWSATDAEPAMLILGIETATEQVGVAIGGHEGVIATFEVARGRRHAETLTPAIEFVCRQSDIELGEIGCIAVDVGPGLFTGMRVGLAAGKALAQALRVPMIGITSLDLLAFPLPAHRPCRRARHRRPQERGVLGDVPAGAGRRAAGQPADGRSGRRARRRPAGAQPGRAVRRRRRRALPRRDRRGLPLRDRRADRIPRSARWCSWPTPARCARSGCVPTRSSRCTCARPTPRSTGPSARRGHERAVAAAEPVRR